MTKLDASGSALLYSTYLGGRGSFDVPGDIAIDAEGNAYVTGRTNSPDFPTTPLAWDTGSRNTVDAFVTKLNAIGSALVYSTRLGGVGTGINFTSGSAIVVDDAGNAYVTGSTSSSAFPTTPGAFDTAISPGADFDGFLTKLDAAGTSLIYSTYLGGAGSDAGTGVAIDAAGNVYVAGSTASPDFPITPGAFDPVLDDGVVSRGDAFVMKISFADTTPPVTTLEQSPSVLWPPNGKLVPVDISGTMTDNGSGIDPSTAAFHVVDQYGAIQPAGSIAVMPSGSYALRVLLEASRHGQDRDGRRYEIWVTVADRAGNQSSVSAIVTVPHDQPDR